MGPLFITKNFRQAKVRDFCSLQSPQRKPSPLVERGRGEEGEAAKIKSPDLLGDFPVCLTAGKRFYVAIVIFFLCVVL
jgi:hypothetical protein